MSERLVPNFDMSKAIVEYLEERAERAAAKAESARSAAVPLSPIVGAERSLPEGTQTVKSLAELGAMFSLLGVCSSVRVYSVRVYIF